MLVEGIIITSVVCGSLLIGYLLKLLFMCKIKVSDCCTHDAGIHIERSIESEKKNVSSLRIPL